MFDQYLSTRLFSANAAPAEEIAKELALNYSDLLPANRAAEILDVGCGMGHMLRFLRDTGFSNACGIDVSTEVVAYCRENFSLNVEFIADLGEYLQAHSNEFDLIVVKDVIEHLARERLISILRDLRDALKSDGALLIETGNMAALTGAYLFFNDYTHQSGFSEASLRQVLLLAGFQQVEIRGNRVQMNWRGRILFALWTHALQFIYFCERGRQGTPKILARLLIAKATRD